MPRFFFHVQDGSPLPDTEGTVLPNLQTARTEAVRLAGVMMADAPADIWEDGKLQVQVTSDGGAVVAIVQCSAIRPS